MAIFGRNTARQRLRRAAEESLSIPAFKTPAVDCTPWVTGGLWPAELSSVTAETAPLVKYLKADLQKIVTSANEELKKIRCAGLVDSERRAHEARVINDARAYAVRRVESSVRQLHEMTTKRPAREQPVEAAAEAESAPPRFKLVPPPPEIPDTPESLTATTGFEPAEEYSGRQPETPVYVPAVDAAPAESPDSGESFDSDETTAFPAASPPDSDETTAFAMPDPLGVDNAAQATDPESRTAATDLEPAEDHSGGQPEPPVDAPAVDSAPAEPPHSAELAESHTGDDTALPEPFDSDETTEIAVPRSPDVDYSAPSTAPDPRKYTAAADSDETTEIEVPRAPQPAESVEPPARDTTGDAAPDLPSPLAPDDTQALEEIANLMQEFSATLSLPLQPPPPPAAREPPPATFNPFIPAPIDLEPPRDFAAARHAKPPPMPSETTAEQLERLVLFVARQEPDLRWAVGVQRDGAPLLVTDIAHGWIPPGITLPADVHLLAPGRRDGALDALLGQTEVSATYAPGDPLGWAADEDITVTSPQPRTLPAIDDLGWVLSDATHWRDGLPRMVSTLAKAAARGAGVAGTERDVLSAYLDTARYQLFAQYPAVEPALLLNCMLLAAAEALAGNDVLSANYHLAWFQKLNSPNAA